MGAVVPPTALPVPEPPPSMTPATPATILSAPRYPVPWSTGLCDCCDNINICCLTCWCPCITFGRIAEVVDRGSTCMPPCLFLQISFLSIILLLMTCGVSGALYSVVLCVSGCSCLYSCFYRSKLRGQYFLEESPCADCCVHVCCEMCALCQEYRHLQNEGLDLSIGI
ncbi:hypothetical protein F511_40374 [Dorcoceras hygrometricum]|uniref:Uncharacterized protein n=1 Tax=Dorcoceras hygrometricum TaxID=472368 RepID=A0A2Z7DAR1_9LAMI|nr:hypothetical protein F511_40374 [Dorcoceras hygrometricum]